MAAAAAKKSIPENSYFEHDAGYLYSKRAGFVISVAMGEGALSRGSKIRHLIGN